MSEKCIVPCEGKLLFQIKIFTISSRAVPLFQSYNLGGIAESKNHRNGKIGIYQLLIVFIVKRDMTY